MWAETLFYVTSSSILTATALAAAWRFRIFRMGEAAIKIDLDVTKPKPKWDVHLPDFRNPAGRLAGVIEPLIAGSSCSAASPRLSGWPAQPGNC